MRKIFLLRKIFKNFEIIDIVTLVATLINFGATSITKEK
jgi:hypothetical protein